MKVYSIKEALAYDKDTGVFTWKLNYKRNKVGDRADKHYRGSRYRTIMVERENFRAHQLAWFFVYDEWPQSDIDHKDRNSQNNAINNLRLCSDSQNQGNTGARRNNKLGVKGVRKSDGKYRAEIKVNGKNKHLGLFDSIKMAHDAYVTAAKNYYGEFACGK